MTSQDEVVQWLARNLADWPCCTDQAINIPYDNWGWRVIGFEFVVMNLNTENFISKDEHFECRGQEHRLDGCGMSFQELMESLFL